MSLVGRLEDLALPDIFQIISLSKKTGTLIVRSRKGTGMVVFKDGQVIQAANDSIRDSLGNILVSSSLVDEPTLAKAVSMQQRNLETEAPLGRILVAMGAISQEMLEVVIRKQIGEIVSDLLTWEEGFFNFELGEITPKDAIEINTQEFLLNTGIQADALLSDGGRAPVGGGLGPRPGMPAPSRPSTSSKSAAPANREPARAELKSAMQTPERSGDIKTLRSMFDELRFPTATAEVTLLILRYASEVVNRAVLFMVKRDEVRGLGQFGIELPDGRSADQVVRNIRVPLDQPSLFRAVIETRRSFFAALEANPTNLNFIAELGGEMPDRAIAVPLAVEGRIALIVYGDNLPEKKPIQRVDTLELFMNQAGLALEKALLEKRLADLQKEKQ